MISAIGCTRDDICSVNTDTTPKLIITFKDISNPLVSKSVSNLTILSADNIDLRVFETATTDSIAIPINPNLDLTSLLFIKNDVDDTGDTDALTFNYMRENIYVNRACAFKTIFSELNPVLTPEDDATWIRTITLLNTMIENEIEAHLTILH